MSDRTMPGGRPLRVLLADDNALVRAGVRRVLEITGRFELVGETERGDETLEALARTTPDVLLLDLNMPGGDGFEVLRRLKSVSPTTRVLVLTMHAQSEYVTRAVREGAHGYLVKDLAVQELVAAIDAVTAGRSWYGAQAQEALAASLRTAHEPTPVERLTPREREVLVGIAKGLTTKEIAAKHHLSARTVESHRANLMRKLDLHSVATLTQFAIREGLIASPA